MESIPLFIFYLNSFFLSIVIIKSKILEYWLLNLFSQKNISLQRLLMYFMLFIACVSSVLPNTFVGLIFVCAISNWNTQIRLSNQHKGYIATFFGLGLLYSCNIGGLIFQTGNAGNGVLLAVTSLYNIEMPTYYSFFGWALWSIPLCFILLLLSWSVLCFVFQANKLPPIFIDLQKSSVNGMYKMGNYGIRLLALYWIFFAILSFITKYSYTMLISSIVISIILFFVLIYILFFKNHYYIQKNKSIRLLKIPDLYQYITLKSLVVIAIAVTLALVSNIFRESIFGNIGNLLEPLFANDLIVMYIMSLISTFLTEVFSNTAILYILTNTIYSISYNMEISNTLIALVITVSSSFAFMFPIATSVSALVYGGIKDFQIKKMLYCGFIINIIFCFFTPTFLFLFIK